MPTLILRSLTRLFPIAVVLGALTVTAVAQERDRSKTPTSTSGTSPTSIRPRPRGAPRRSKLAAEIPQLDAVQGQARLVGRRRSPTRSTAVRARQGTVAAVRLRQHARRSGHARRAAPGHAAGDGAARRRVRRRGVVRRARDPARPTRRRIETFLDVGAAAEDLRVLPATTSRAAPRTR